MAHRIRGRVIDSSSHLGIPGVRVEAWDKDFLLDDLVGEATSDHSGLFEIVFEDSHFRELFFDRKPDLFFRAFLGERLVADTRDRVLWNASRNVEVTIEVTDATGTGSPGGSAIETYVVHGKVMNTQGKPLVAAKVTVYGQRIRSRTPIAATRTTAEGNYRVTYRPPTDFGGTLLVVVRVTSSDLSAPIESKPTPARSDLAIDLAPVPTDASEFAVLMRGITPLLDGLEFTDLVESNEHHDLSFLAQELGKSSEDIMRVVVAERLAAATTIPAAVFYAFLRQRAPAALPSPLLEASEGFTLIEPLVRHIGELIAALHAEVDQRVLTTAIAAGLIGTQYAEQIPSIISALQAQHTQDLLSRPFFIGKATLQQLLDVSQLPSNKQTAFAQALASNNQSMRNFWRTLGDGKHGFTAAEASAVQRTLSVGAFVKNHVPLLKILLQGFDSGEYRSLPDLARLSLEKWMSLVSQSGPPPSIDPASNESAAEVFARVVYARLSRAYPTAALSSRVATGKLIPEAQRAPLQQFFQNNPSLELVKHNLAVFLENAGDRAFAQIDVKDRPAVVAHARRLQRVLRIAPKVDAAVSLLQFGIDSATGIVSVGRQQFFIKATEAGLTKRVANQVYRAALQRYASVVSAYTRFNRDAIGIWPQMIGNVANLNDPIQKAVARDQSLSSLFGSQDYCAVDSCTSILSPAAYLCDLLLWLRNHPQSGHTALAILDSRRPDIRHLLLNCPNSETPLPYIDLVNELLADAVSPPTDPNSTTNPLWKQTSANKSAGELRAAPEYFNAGAFVTLAGANYPHTLPYSAGLDELRSYLAYAKVPLWQLREALLSLHGPAITARAAVGAERLNLSPHDESLLITPNLVPPDTAWNVASAPSALASVPKLLAAAGITYESLLELLQSNWVQGSTGTAIQGVNDSCDTSVQTLAPAPLDTGFLDRAHRFLRLWRRTGLQIWELDLLVRAPSVGNGTLDASALAALEDFWELQNVTRLAVDQQLAFFQDIDVQSHRSADGSSTNSLYARVFLNPAVVAVAPDADLSALATGGTITQPNLSDHLAAIQAALAVSASDATTLFQLTDNTLTLGNLSFVYRIATLARAARLSLTDLLSLAQLFDPAALDPTTVVAALFTSPRAVLSFLTNANKVTQSGFSIDSLVYLLTPPPWTTSSQMTEAEVGAALQQVRDAMLGAAGGDVNGAVIATVAANARHATDAPIANDLSSTILQGFAVGGQPLLTLLTDPALTSAPGGIFTPITAANYPNQFEALQLFDKAALLVRRLRLVNADFSWLLAHAGVYGGLNLTLLPVNTAQAAVPLGSLMTTLLLIQLARLFTHAPPAATIQTLYDLILGVSSGSVPNEADAQAALATITGWPLADVVAFAPAVTATFPTDYQLAITYDALRRLEALAQAAGASGSQLVAWGAVPPDEPSAQSMAAAALGALKAQFPDDTQWLAAVPDIMDPIRERRSAALQAYLIARRDSLGNLIYGDADGLFDHFLIDVQMSSCEVTTRLVQAYIAVQIFVERCLMNLEAPAVIVNPATDDTWNQWQWMKRYRIWQANREVFLYPENWLVESQRPSRTEIFQKLEQDVRQNDATHDYLETVVLNYIDGLDAVANLFITGTCQDPVTRAIYVVGRTSTDPPVYYYRSLVDGAWTGWERIPLDIKTHEAVPAVYRGRLCLFWFDIKVATEPQQNVPAPQASDTPPSQAANKYVSIGIFFSILRNGTWSPAQASKGKLFDIPFPNSNVVNDSRAVESLYTLKVQQAAASPGYGTNLFVDVFRLGDYTVEEISVVFFTIFVPVLTQPTSAVHIGRALFDGRFSDLELRNLPIAVNPLSESGLLVHAQSTYGSDATPLLPLPNSQADPDLAPEVGLIPTAGALVTAPASPTGGSNQTLPLTFSSISALEANVGPLLNAAPIPFRVVGPVTDLAFDPSTYFFFQDNRRSYYVESQRFYWSGSAWSPVVPSNPAGVPFEVRYFFHRFYHPFTRLFWHQLGSGGFPLLYDRNLQLTPDTLDPSGADAFDFQTGYQPVVSRVAWDRNETGQSREFLDFKRDASYSTYNWELFYHVPLFVAELLSQNQQFEDAQAWFKYIFDPTRPGADPAPQRFWIPKPLYELTSPEILAERINDLLAAVNNGDPELISEVQSWRRDPFDPFLIADQRPVAYMKRVVMSYLDNLIAWADNLFATDSREALSEATLLYVTAAEILGPQPTAITPPMHADDSYDQLEPKLDAFANAMVDIENTIGTTGSGGGGGDGLPIPQTFYFKIPANDKLLSYWSTVADRLFKLRHCQNIEGVTRQLALFDAPIDPGLLIRARAAGVDIGSVLADVTAALPAYRFTALYSLCSDFVNAVRAYGTSLLGAIEKTDSATLAMLQQTTAQQLLRDGAQVLDWQHQQAEHALEALNQALLLAQAKLDFNKSQSFANPWEITGTTLHAVAGILKVIGAAIKTVGAVAAPIPLFTVGAAGFGGTPVAVVSEGGPNVAHAGHLAGLAVENYGDIAEIAAGLANTIGSWQRRQDNWDEAAKEAQISIDQTKAQIAGAELAIMIAAANQAKNDEQIENIQKQVDYLTDKFTNQDLYDWMVSSLSAVYFQSYKLAYKICKQVERCYRFELGVPDSSFIQFGYWDSLRKGLLAGELLNHDLRQMQASYFDLNRRRFELSRFVSLAAINPAALRQLLLTGACDFDLPESLFDNDYPGHYNRRLVRVSVTVVYPNPGKFDNVKGTLTLAANKVRTSTDVAAGYAETPVGSDARFVYNYAAVPQKIALGNAQDDPGLFVTAIGSNISDQRYLPFENAGAVSSWHFELPADTNEIDIAAVSDVVVHLYYTALDGGDPLKAAAQVNNAANAPTSGLKMLSALNDFGAPAASAVNPYPISPWKAFLGTPAGSDQTLTLSVSASQFPSWTRGKTVTITEIAFVSVAWTAGNFVLQPQAPLPSADLTLAPLAGTTEPAMSGATLTLPPGTAPGSWTFKLRRQSATDFRSLKSSDIGDLLLFVTFRVS